MNNPAPAPSPRTILFLDHTAVLGGGEIALFNLITHLDHKRFHPVVLLFSHGELEERLRSENIETHVLPLSPTIVHTRKDQLDRSAISRVRDIARTLNYVFKLRRFISKRHPDIVHTNSLKADIIGGFAGRLAGIAVLWHVRDRIADDYLPPKVVRMFRVLCRLIPTAVIANSQATFETLQLPARPGDASRAVLDGISVAREPDVQRPHKNAPIIGIVGRITSWKGQHVFLDAVAILAEEFREARFQIIGGALFGEEEYERQLHRQATHLKLDGRVEWLGFRDDVPQLIEQLDILVHASTSGEPFGQVVVEGMVAGKPVIATRGGGVPEIIEDGVSGVLVPMNDAPAMAAAIRELLGNPVRAQQIGRAGFERVRDHFTIQRVARDVEAVYDALLSSPQSK